MDRALEIRIREDFNARLKEQDHSVSFTRSNVLGDSDLVFAIELQKPNEYHDEEYVAIRFFYDDESDERIVCYGKNEDVQYSDGYYDYMLYPGLLKIPHWWDGQANDLLSYDMAKEAVYWFDFTESNEARTVQPGMIRYEDSFDITLIEPWRADIDGIISISDLEKLGEIPESFAVVKFTIPEVPRFSYKSQKHYNEFGQFLFSTLGIDEDPDYVPVTVTRVYMLSEFGKVTHTAEILEFPNADDAVRFDCRLYATEDPGYKGRYTYVSDIRDADTYEYRKRYTEEELKNDNLEGFIEGNKIYFPYDLEKFGTSQGELILSCYGICDENDNPIQENEIAEFTDKNGYRNLANGTVQYIYYTTWVLNNVTQVDDKIKKEPCEIKMYIYRKENR
ncbi:MAG: hypothetical protein K6G57_03810 [Lachnospiraceae bacterium]|nr:hypothetical protein [Lachnospiraceae bacterium]